MRKIGVLLAVTLGLTPVLLPRSGSADEHKAAPTWERMTEDSGIVVFRQEVPGSSVIAFKGVGTVDAPLSQVIAAVTDTPRATEWMDATVESRVLRKVSPLEQIVYTHIKTPPGLTDRDFVTDARGELDPTVKRFTVHIRSVTDPAAPQTSFVRGEIYKSSFVLTGIEGGKRTLVTTEIHADPKGSIPTFIANAFQKDWPIHTIKNLRKQAQKPDVHPSPELAAALAKAGF
ncbi:MAG: hypothetical protein IPK71_16640 [Myxococcales bacterium]|jgi:hypothetical protein|nr:hypothetical protein [Myxococcales bacterium]MBL9111395.1 hypothetical protein [Myxococcales bacterium]